MTLKFIFFKLNDIYMVSLLKKIETQWNQSIKPIRITENISVWKKCSGQALFKRPNLRPGQLLKPGQKFVWGHVWGQASPMGPGQASFYSMPYGQFSSHVTAVMTVRLDNQLWSKGWVILSEPFTFNWMIYVEQFACKITGNDDDMDFWTFYKSMTQTVHRKERGKLK